MPCRWSSSSRKWPISAAAIADSARARQRRRRPRVLGEAVEGGQLAVGEHAEQVHGGGRPGDRAPRPGWQGGGDAVVMPPSLMVPDAAAGTRRVTRYGRSGGRASTVGAPDVGDAMRPQRRSSGAPTAQPGTGAPPASRAMIRHASTTWCVQRLVGSPTRAPSGGRRAGPGSCAERGDHPVRRPNTPDSPNPTRRREDATEDAHPLQAGAPGPARVPYLRRARRPPRDRRARWPRPASCAPSPSRS